LYGPKGVRIFRKRVSTAKKIDESVACLNKFYSCRLGARSKGREYLSSRETYQRHAAVLLIFEETARNRGAFQHDWSSQRGRVEVVAVFLGRVENKLNQKFIMREKRCKAKRATMAGK